MDSTRVDEPHLFVDFEGRHILTFVCRGCRRSNMISLGKVARDAPANYTSFDSMLKRFGEAGQ
jgi:hypothetical protein